MDAGKTEALGQRQMDFITHCTTSSMSISVFMSLPLHLQDTQQQHKGLMSTQAVGCIPKE